MKSGVMNSAHAHRIAHFVILVLFDTFLPIFAQNFAVSSFNGIVIDRIRIPFALDPRIPFILVTAQQHITVGSPDNNPHLFSKCAIFRVSIKKIYMHCWPNVICFEA
ncbi:hypothetical protein D3C81_690360 [compost metagenome]